MISTIDSPLASLAAEMEAHAACERTELTLFPSGGAMLDVHRRDGRTFVLAHSPEQGYGVDEIRADEGLGATYQYAYSDFSVAADKLRELVSEGNGASEPTAALKLVVLYVRDVEVTKSFYECLGLSFRAEKHGHGPQHYAAIMGSTVFEVYPCQADSNGGPIRIGFEVISLEKTLHALRRQSAKVCKESHDSPWGRRAVVEDPDGNRVELTER
jgi:lactoylglutathione lyase